MNNSELTNSEFFQFGEGIAQVSPNSPVKQEQMRQVKTFLRGKEVKQQSAVKVN